MIEIWKDIRGFEGIYQISNLGNVRSITRDVFINHPTKPHYRHIKGKPLSAIRDKDGYLVISLFKKGKEKNVKIHRLVAEAFIENNDNLPQVNHKDGNKENNIVSNLEWCSNLYNQLHAYRIGLKKTKQIAKINLHTNKILKIYSSLPSICEDLAIDPSTLIKVCKGKRNHHKGFKWTYATPNMKVGDIID